MATLKDRTIARVQRMEDLKALVEVPMVSVLPKDANIRKYIAHMPGNIRFPAEGAVRWPYDKFTKRRIADGDVTLVQPR